MSPNQIELAGSKVLIVDDVPANLKVLREVLEPRGFRILLAPRGELALKIARSELPDLILLDVMMPEMDGFEVCRRLKSEPVTAHIPVIFITAKDEPEDIVKGLRSGGVDYISKPFQADVVVARTETHLRNSKLAQELRQKNQELEKARDVAEQAKKAQSTFLATMSHEIRTPINGVLVMTALLGETPLNAEQHDFVETIRHRADALLRIINEILDFSKIESGKMTFESRPFDLRRSVEETLDLLAAQAAHKEIDLAYDPDEDAPETLVGDETRLRQILLNLAGNAVKFTSRGEVVVKARQERVESVEGNPVRTWIEFSVRDTGIGIPSDRQDRLFQAFTQVDSSTTRQYGGTGLGLAISKRLVEMMGGKIWGESEVGAGSVFRFILPFEIVSQTMPDTIGANPSFAGKRILIVEDNPTNCEILVRHSRQCGLLPQMAASASEALAKIQLEPFPVIILDWQLPDSNGLELARQIRQSAHGRDASLIPLSSTPVRSSDSRLASVRIAAVVSKPIRRTQFLAALQCTLDPEFKETRTTPKTTESASLAERLPLRILLADDHLVNQKVGALMLQRFGYRCEIAANGLEVIEALQRQSFDIIFLDAEMPEMDGYETTRQIHERWAGVNRPRIVAMTANALAGDREKCLQAGMDGYMAKPVSLEALQQALMTWGGGGRAENLERRAAPIEAAPEVAPSKNAPTSLPSQDAAFIDWNRLTQLTAGNPALVQEFMELYVSQTAQALRELESAIEAGDVSAVVASAHKCKGASATCGLTGAAEIFQKLESLAREGALRQAPEVLRAAKAAFEEVCQALQNRLDSLRNP